MHSHQSHDPEAALVDALDAADEYLAQQHALAALLRSGFLNMARARYAMGANSVRPSQYATAMEAFVCVAAQQGTGGQPGDWRLQSRAAEREGCATAGAAESAGSDTAVPAGGSSACTAGPPAAGSAQSAGGGGRSGADAGYSSLVADFAARFACSADEAGSGSEPSAAAAAASAAPGAERPAGAPAAAPDERRGAAPPPDAAQGGSTGAAPATAGPQPPACAEPPPRAPADSPDRDGRARRDPLHWFGALAPPSLRAGQVRRPRPPVSLECMGSSPRWEPEADDSMQPGGGRARMLADCAACGRCSSSC
jgi:hypothetical protein